MAELIDIEAPFLPAQMVESAVSTPVIFWVIAAVVVIALLWLLKSAAFRHWRELLAWKKEGGAWALYYQIQRWQSKSAFLSEVQRTRLQKLLQQTAFFASQSEKLNPSQLKALQSLFSSVKRDYWVWTLSVFVFKQKKHMKSGVQGIFGRVKRVNVGKKRD